MALRSRIFLSIALIIALLAGAYLVWSFSAPADTGPMTTSSLSRCDLNADGRCDAADLALFQQSLGKNRGDLGYSPFADANADGIVNAVDQQMLFPVTSPITAPAVTTATISPAPSTVSR